MERLNSCSWLPEILIEIGVRDLLQRLDVVNGDQMRVEIHKLDAGLFERPLGQQMTLDP